MHLKSWARSAALAATFILTGCNIFNPNGAAKASCSGSDVECYMALGQALINEKDFAGSMAAYETAIGLDSTRSEAYWGYGRAAVYAFNINMGKLLGDISKADTNVNVFMNHPDEVLTQRIRLAHKIVTIADVMMDRDTLNTAWLYLTDSAKYKNRPDYASKVAFIKAYLDTAGPSRRAEKFPLMDGDKNFDGLLVEFLAYKFLYQVMDFNDLGEKLLFNESDRKMRGIFKSDGSLGGLGDLATQMEGDSIFQQEVNDKIVELQSGLGDLSSLLSYIGAGNDTGKTTEAQTKAKMDSAITGLGGTLIFYQFGDQLDNDADGCIDEEIVDSLDNDLDGFVDEDARLVKGTGTSTDPGDKVNNDRQFTVDDFRENKVGPLPPYQDRYYVLTFVASYLNDNNEISTPEKNTTWVKIKKDAPNIDTRIAVQADSLAVRLTPGQPVPPQYQTALQNAKTQIGGCWRFY